MKNQSGFTLVELIIVIVILGILAVTAAPRFIDIQSDARAGALQGVKAALESASQLVYAKSAISGVQSDGDADDAIAVISGINVRVIYGYPEAEFITDTNAVSAFLDIDAAEFTAAVATGDDTQFVITFNGEAEADNCFVRYTEPENDGDTPDIVVVPGGC